MTPKNNYLTPQQGRELIQKLKNEPSFWYEFIELPKARQIFKTKMKSCNIAWDRYDDLVSETYCHLCRDNWRKLDNIEEPERFWGWFAQVVQFHFWFTKDEKTGEYIPKKALRELIPMGTTSRMIGIAESPDEDEQVDTIQVADPRPLEKDVLWNDYKRQFITVLDRMKASSRKSFPLYAEVIERIAVRHEERPEIAIDLLRRGLLKGTVKDDGCYSKEDIIRLRDNLNNNIYRRGREFFNEIALQYRFECII